MAFNERDLWLALMLGARPGLPAACVFLLGYALGSIPFGWIFSHLGGAGDIRKIGSGNIGATNVLRTGRKGLALLTLVSDAAKGFVPVLACQIFLGPPFDLVAAAGAFAGHLFPVWLKFKGGKGVATYIGVILALNWPAGVFFCGVWLVIAIFTRYSSLSALIAAAMTPVFVLVQVSAGLAAFVAALSVALIARHRRNIRNLISGQEGEIRLSGSGG